MAQATQAAAPQAGAAALPQDPSQLLDLILSKAAPPQKLALAEATLDRVFNQMAVNDRFRLVKTELEKRVELVEKVIPTWLKGQGERLVELALMTLTRKHEMTGCPPISFIRAVIEAATLGLAIDGRLAHCVPFKGQWQLIVDYKGVVAVARRSGVIIDAKADVVCKNDTFEHGRAHGRSHLSHTFDPKQPRGEVVAAYCIVRYGRGEHDWNYELMERDELDRIRRRSAAVNSSKGPSGPWVTDEREMQKKTVVRRALKMHTDDPSIARLMDRLDQQDGFVDGGNQQAQQPRVASTLDELKAGWRRQQEGRPDNGLTEEVKPAEEEPPAPEEDKPRRRRRGREQTDDEPPQANPQAPAAQAPPAEDEGDDLPISGSVAARVVDLAAKGTYLNHLVQEYLGEHNLTRIEALTNRQACELIPKLELAAENGGSE